MTKDEIRQAMAQFKDIAPYPDSEFHQHMAELVQEPMFENAVRFAIPNVDWPQFKQQLLAVQSKRQFHADIMRAFLEQLGRATTDGITSGGMGNIQAGVGYTYITNHRDIVLDASLLNLCLVRQGMPLTEVAIGDNLLIYPWITKLVKLNNSFIVRRGLRLLEALHAAKHLSGYIHLATARRHISVWIAQREGRAKDSNDMTQEGLVKMLALGGEGDIRDSLAEINLMPASLSYEYDPNDYLKATEFLMKRRDPAFKKSQRDDLLSMETGMLGHKGRVHIEFTPCLSEAIRQLPKGERGETVRRVCQMVDNQIHRGYRIYPGNYVAYDRLSDQPRFAELYTQAEADSFEAYVQGQLDEAEVPDLKADEREFMHRKILEMYANPVKNKLKAEK